jgi:hypothetical protein
VRRYGSRRIRYRAMYVRIGNPMVGSIDRTKLEELHQDVKCEIRSKPSPRLTYQAN